MPSPREGIHDCVGKQGFGYRHAMLPLYRIYPERATHPSFSLLLYIASVNKVKTSSNVSEEASSSSAWYTSIGLKPGGGKI
ncbi:hypothetical protein ACFS3C_10325 [Azotobacter vinelandii]